MNEKQLEEVGSFNRYISAENLKKPAIHHVWLPVLLAGMFVGLVFEIVMIRIDHLSTEYFKYIAGGIAFLTVGSVVAQFAIRNRKWREYLQKRQKSYDVLRQDRQLYEQTILDFDHAKRYWGRIAVGEKHLFLQGHLPIRYTEIRSVQYQIREQQRTTSGTIPEKLGFLVELVGGQHIILQDLPCPMEERTPREGRLFSYQARVSLESRVLKNKQYAEIIANISRMRTEARKGSRAGEKSVNEALTY